MSLQCRTGSAIAPGRLGIRSSSSRTACKAAVAKITVSNTWPSICQCASCCTKRLTRLPSLIAPPRCTSQRAAACGKSVPRSTRGSSSREPPATPNRASPSTRRNTLALARGDGVFRADTHRGSINSAITRGVRPWHSSDTLSPLAQSKPRHFQPSTARSNPALSFHCQPTAVSSPTSVLKGAGKFGRRRPAPSAKRSVMGRLCRACSMGTPTRRIRRRVSV